MSVPARRQSRTRTRNRRANHGLKAVNTAGCSNCEAPVLSHVACSNCGFYKGKQVLNVTRQKEREVKRLQRKAFEKSQAAEDAAAETTEETVKEEVKETEEKKPKAKAAKKKKEEAPPKDGVPPKQGVGGKKSE